MAREPDKSARETGKAKSEATAGSRSGANDETAGAKSGAPETVELLKTQHRDLQATLAKRSGADADPSAIVKEFAIAWLPHMAVERDILVPALNDAGIDEDKIAAIAIQKDIINLLLADLLRDESGQFGRAKLEALAKQVDALLAGAEGEDNGLFAIVSAAESSIPGLNAQMKARYDRTKQRFANMDEAIGEAMVMLAPRRLSVPSGSRQNRREFEMSRYSNVRERDDQGRFTSDDESGYRGSRSAGRDRDDQGRFMSEGGRSSRGRHEDDDDRRYSRGGPERDENGRFMSEGGSRSRGRYDDEDDRYSRSMGRERDDEGRFTRRGGSYEGRGEATAAGSATRKVTPRLPAADGTIRATARAAGTAIPSAIPRPRAADGTIPVMARAAGTATRKAIPRPRGAGGSMATRATTGAGRRRAMTMMTAGMRAVAAADTRTTTATSAATAVGAVTAVGPAIRKVTRRLRAAAGRTGADWNSGSEFPSNGRARARPFLSRRTEMES